MRRVAIFGGSFNPPAQHHRELAIQLAGMFDEVLIVPCGPRPDKRTVSDVSPMHRAAMVDMTFAGIDRVRVDLSDLETESFTRLWKLEEKYQSRGELWHLIGTDLVVGGHEKHSQIQTSWERGPEIWEALNYIVAERAGYDIEKCDLPPHAETFVANRSGSSTEIRELAFRGKEFRQLVLPKVADYIDRYGLYRGLERREASWRIAEPRPFILADETKKATGDLAAGFTAYPAKEANCIMVIGGDGAMTRAIGKFWNWRLPFIGLNGGTRGHLLNAKEDLAHQKDLTQEMRVRLLPLLFCETVDRRGNKHVAYAVNDAWVERAGGQAANVEISVDGRMSLPRLVADGALVCTPVGSTSYAHAMGASSLPVGADEIMLVASNPSEPIGWRPATLSGNSIVDIKNLDSRKRPLRGYVDGRQRGIVTTMTVRKSRVATAELMLLPHRDLAGKVMGRIFH